jgi:hypothetical protein
MHCKLSVKYSVYIKIGKLIYYQTKHISILFIYLFILFFAQVVKIKKKCFRVDFPHFYTINNKQSFVSQINAFLSCDCQILLQSMHR